MLKVLMLRKHMKQKAIIKKNTWRRLTGVPVLVLATVLTVGTTVVPSVRADQYDDQIRQLQQQTAAARGSLDALRVTAASYQDAINQLQTQIDQVQGQINANLAQQASLQQQIDANQKQLDEQRATLAADIKQMYVDGQPTTLEMLASSGNLSDFVDKEQYRTDVQDKIQDSLKKIGELQKQLKDQKIQVDHLLADQQTQQAQLDDSRAQQAHLLSMNQGEQAAYNQTIKNNSSQITDLRQKQILANLSGASGILYGGACGGGPPGFSNTYPTSVTLNGRTYRLCDAAQDSVVDPWGLYNRECVSYVAWKEYVDGKYVPYGLGNAGDWPSHVPRSWIVDTPRAGDVAVRPTNPNLYFGSEQDVGHVMYIEGVNDNGTLAISQYNASLNGTYSFVASKSTSGLTFIRFPDN